jgi:hypothetical protein
MPISVRAKRLDPGKPAPAAIMFGPIVLAGPLSGKASAWDLDPNDVASALDPEPSVPGSFRLKKAGSVVLRPFYTFGPGEEYFMYVDPRMTDFDVISYSGAWTVGYDLGSSREPGAIADFAFTGTGISWKGDKSDEGGMAEVAIDGKAAAVIDQYDKEREARFDWKLEGLPAGRHTVRIRVLDDTNPASKGRLINIRVLIPIS